MQMESGDEVVQVGWETISMPTPKGLNNQNWVAKLKKMNETT